MTPKTYEVLGSLGPEGHKSCGYGCDSPYLVNCNCSAHYPDVCPRHKLQVVKPTDLNSAKQEGE